jgi:hypothetical protein
MCNFSSKSASDKFFKLLRILKCHYFSFFFLEPTFFLGIKLCTENCRVYSSMYFKDAALLASCFSVNIFWWKICHPRPLYVEYLLIVAAYKIFFPLLVLYNLIMVHLMWFSLCFLWLGVHWSFGTIRSSMIVFIIFIKFLKFEIIIF